MRYADDIGEVDVGFPCIDDDLVRGSVAELKKLEIAFGLYTIAANIKIRSRRFKHNEKKIIEPTLSKLGYKFHIDSWWTVGGNEFGPYTRAIEAYGPEGENVIIWYEL